MSESIDFRDLGHHDGLQVVAIVGVDEFPVALYYWLNGLGHANDSYFNIPKLLGWITYTVENKNLIITELQSDVMSLTSYWKHAPEAGQAIIRQYKSKLENRYKNWIDETLKYIDNLAISRRTHQIVIDLADLEEGMRLRKIQSAADRAGYAARHGQLIKQIKPL